jgi:retron-type reverse transcriptase
MLSPGFHTTVSLRDPEEGTTQGGVISPILSTIYLHEVLDQWFVQSVQPACGGRSLMVRFADGLRHGL